MLLIEHNNKELRVDADDQREPIYLLFSDVLHTGRPKKSVILVDMAMAIALLKSIRNGSWCVSENSSHMLQDHN